ncbi:MAG: Glyoxalase/bleomycin resistance protein/dioxygenase [Pseudonocardia sp.]|nr:Glyoxalase/bleomycin resistance protein/dioxygenase [Pseudonocardia sp.]
MPDGAMPTPGGWNGSSIEVDDLTAVIDTLREAGVRLRSDVVIGVGGKPVLPAVLSGADSVARVLHLGPHLPDSGVGCYPSFRGRRSGGVAARGENVQLDELIHPVPVRHVVSLYDTHDTTVAQWQRCEKTERHHCESHLPDRSQRSTARMTTPSLANLALLQSGHSTTSAACAAMELTMNLPGRSGGPGIPATDGRSTWWSHRPTPCPAAEWSRSHGCCSGWRPRTARQRSA